MSKQGGFSAIELLIVVAIIGILAAIAIPNYMEYLVRSKVPHATSALANKRVQMEQYFQDNRTYAGAPACNADTTTSQYFDFSCSGAATATTYTLQAVGKSAMAGFTYTIDQSGARATDSTFSGWLGNASCWVTRKGGLC